MGIKHNDAFQIRDTDISDNYFSWKVEWGSRHAETQSSVDTLKVSNLACPHLDTFTPHNNDDDENLLSGYQVL